MSFGEIMGALSQYGVIPTIIGILILVGLKAILDRRDRKNKEDQYNREEQRIEKDREWIVRIMEENNKSLEEKLTERALHSKGIHSIEEENEGMKLTTFIHNELKMFREEFGAQRTFFMSYHNGLADTIGNSYLKMTLREEEIKPGTAPIASYFQNVMRSMLPTLNQNIHNDGQYYICDIETIKESDYATYLTLKQFGVESSFFKEVKAQNGMIIGFVSIQFDHITKENKNITKRLCDTAEHIAGALSMFKIKK